MALGKILATPYGCNASYWKIANVIEDFVAQASKITLAGYLTAEARQAGAQPLAGAAVELAQGSYVADLDRKAMYAAIKALPAWTDAEDC
jgi:hypothetical protein